jgi:hypothetical protein
LVMKNFFRKIVTLVHIYIYIQVSVRDITLECLQITVSTKNIFFYYSLKLNFICYLNRFFTFDYSLWDEGRHTFLRAKTNFNYTDIYKFPVVMVKSRLMYFSFSVS